MVNRERIITSGDRIHQEFQIQQENETLSQNTSFRQQSLCGSLFVANSMHILACSFEITNSGSYCISVLRKDACFEANDDMGRDITIIVAERFTVFSICLNLLYLIDLSQFLSLSLLFLRSPGVEKDRTNRS